MKELVEITEAVMYSATEMRDAKAQYDAHNLAHDQYVERGMIEAATGLEDSINIHLGEYVGWKNMYRYQLSQALTILNKLN